MSAAALKIKVFGNNGTQLVSIAKSTATVGSAAHCDLVLSHETVQPEHVRVWCEGGRIWVQDLGGATGTTLNGIRLPHLKPMLVRELDTMKLGECPSTLGLEPNLVRAPVVKSVNIDDITMTDIKPLATAENKREELEAAGRELAELKLQLQMTRLNSNSSEDSVKQVSILNEEINELKDERQKLQASFEVMDREKRGYKDRFENEVAELKLKSLRELKEQREQDQRVFESWKKEAVSALCLHYRQILEAKAKTARQFTREMILQWQDDFDNGARRILLKMTSNANSKPDIKSLTPPLPDSFTATMPTGKSSILNTSSATVVTPTTSTSRKKKSKRSRSLESIWNRLAVITVGLAVFLSALWLLSSYLNMKSNSRSLASRSQQSVRVLPTSPPAVPSAFAPKQTKGFKKSYTDNILYTVSYAEAEMNLDFRSLWTKELGRTARGEWRIEDPIITSILTKELVFIQDLARIRTSIVTNEQEREGVARMRAREVQFLRELKEHLGGRTTPERFINAKRAFFTRNQVYLVRENR